MQMLKIIRCSDPQQWYAHLIGQCVPYLGTWAEAYKSREPAGYVNRVAFADAELVSIGETTTHGHTSARQMLDNKGNSMETMTQPKIAGYRQLSEEEAALMNEGKALAEQCGAFIDKLRLYDHTESRTNQGGGIHLLLDQRWISIGATDLQRGFMAVMRGIAKPTNF